jgi:ubiquinone/menaquinone biosynthesis C-methylase UbiE
MFMNIKMNGEVIMESYSHLAEYYDMLMEDVDYHGWCCFIEEIFSAYGYKPQRILDTACGTGNITIPMASKGYEMWGVDISEEMLAVAESKARRLKRNIRFLHQDMSELRLNRSFEALLCMCDGVNYILEKEDLRLYFGAAYKALVPGGLFVFDISSHYKLSEILGNNTLFQEKDSFCYVWENSYYEEEHLLEMHLNFFIPWEGLYKREQEHHVQRAYKEEQLKSLLKEAGFGNIRVFDDLKLETPKSKSERIFFAAQKL